MQRKAPYLNAACLKCVSDVMKSSPLGTTAKCILLLDCLWCVNTLLSQTKDCAGKMTLKLMICGIFFIFSPFIFILKKMKCIRFIITTTAHQLYSHVLQYAFAIVDQALIAISI